MGGTMHRHHHPLRVIAATFAQARVWAEEQGYQTPDWRYLRHIGTPTDNLPAEGVDFRVLDIPDDTSTARRAELANLIEFMRWTPPHREQEDPKHRLDPPPPIDTSVETYRAAVGQLGELPTPIRHNPIITQVDIP